MREEIDGILDGLGAGPHNDNNALGIFRPVIAKKIVLASGQFGKFVHRFLNDLRARIVIRIDRLPGLKVDIRVLGRSAKNRAVRRQRPGTMLIDKLVVDHRADIIFSQLLDLGNFMGGAKSVEEMDERNAGLKSRRVGDQGKIHDFLDAI